jgi:hypothetical protein|tara:strand:+ start:187 stop:390 length:204 start_codon:yes stop_codon:yes gene_type:complete
MVKMKVNNQKQKPVDRKVLSFFILGFPIIVLVLIMMLPEWRFAQVIALTFYELVLLKQFMDNYYEVL